MKTLRAAIIFLFALILSCNNITNNVTQTNNNSACAQMGCCGGCNACGNCCSCDVTEPSPDATPDEETDGVCVSYPCMSGFSFCSEVSGGIFDICHTISEMDMGICTSKCENDSDCPSGYVCGKEGEFANQCICPYVTQKKLLCEKCISDEDCFPGLKCLPTPDGLTKICTTKCDNFLGECPGITTCDEGSGICLCEAHQPPQPQIDCVEKCETDKDCIDKTEGVLNRCEFNLIEGIDTMCTRVCKTDEECPDDYVCNLDLNPSDPEAGFCVCKEINPPDDGTVECVVKCDNNEKCIELTDGILNVCVADLIDGYDPLCTKICANDAQCPDGYVCAKELHDETTGPIAPITDYGYCVCKDIYQPQTMVCKECQSDEECGTTPLGNAMFCMDTNGDGTKECTTVCGEYSDDLTCPEGTVCNDQKICECQTHCKLFYDQDQSIKCIASDANTIVIQEGIEKPAFEIPTDGEPGNGNDASDFDLWGPTKSLWGDLISNAHCNAKWIWGYKPEWNHIDTYDVCFDFYRKFSLPNAVTSACLEITADDTVDVFINSVHITTHPSSVSWYNITSVSVEPSIFIPGENIIKFHVCSVNPKAGGFLYNLLIK